MELFCPNLKKPNIDKKRIVRPYPASPNINPKKIMKKIPIKIVGFNSLYFGVANNSKKVRNDAAHFGVSK
jgi:hypothetical protein